MKQYTEPFSKWFENRVEMSELKKVGHNSYLSSWQQKRREREMAEIKELNRIPPHHGDKVMLIVDKIIMLHGLRREKETVTGFFDNGSTCSLVDTTMAKKYGLVG